MNTTDVHQLLASAMINHLTGRPRGAWVFEQLAINSPSYTDEAFRAYLIGLAKRQISFAEDVPAAMRTLRRTLLSTIRDTPIGIAVMALTVALMYHEMNDERRALAYYLMARANFPA